MTVYLQYVAMIHHISQQYIVDKSHFPTAPIFCFNCEIRYLNRPNSPFFLDFVDFLIV